MHKPFQIKRCTETFLILFLLVFVVLDITKPNLAANSCATTVPYSWSFTTTGKSVASVYKENNGPTGTTVTGTDNFSASFNIKRNFTPPSGGWVLAPGEVIPNTTNFTCEAIFDGYYANSTLNGSIGGIGFPTHVNANASVTCLNVGAFSSVQHTAGGSGDLTNQTRVSTPSQVSDNQVIPFSGNVDVDLLFGVGLANLDFMNVFAQVYVSGNIDDQQKNIKYHKPDGTACDDGNPDTTGEQCKSGICEGDPTLVELFFFTATALENSVLIEWETATEIDNAGFHIWRSDEEDGEYIMITDSLILAEGDASTYTYIDENVKDGVVYYYKLEDIDIFDVSTFRYPVSSSPDKVLIIEPAQNAVFTPDTPPIFEWTEGRYSEFKFQFSDDNGRTIHEIPADGWMEYAQT
ncbi:hypothetical protein PN36_04695 [Candidatus Thiomargarita nelsonii]|uniref:Uncharacterized protein n=1 Tax=Candidatus Thiomargarita nelsonii TaxID=1003181 RepID=A0A0A6RYI6_9GAMM|nr:hypothetical protein PN36_04695 [Candidatus Thiomargarita nelsonii]